MTLLELVDSLGYLEPWYNDGYIQVSRSGRVYVIKHIPDLPEVSIRYIGTVKIS